MIVFPTYFTVQMSDYDDDDNNNNNNMTNKYYQCDNSSLSLVL